MTLIEHVEFTISGTDILFNVPEAVNATVVNLGKTWAFTNYINCNVIYRDINGLMDKTYMTRYPQVYNDKLIFDGPEMLVENMQFTGFDNWKYVDGKLHLPRCFFIKKLINIADSTLYYYMYRQQLLYNSKL